MMLLKTAVSEVAICLPTAERLPIAPEISARLHGSSGEATASFLEKEGGSVVRRLRGTNCKVSDVAFASTASAAGLVDVAAPR